MSTDRLAVAERLIASIEKELDKAESHLRGKENSFAAYCSIKRCKEWIANWNER